MKTTVNIPDDLLKEAKRKALDEDRSLTDLLVEGLKGRVHRSMPGRTLPVSAADGGLAPGVDWGLLRPLDPREDGYR